MELKEPSYVYSGAEYWSPKHPQSAHPQRKAVRLSTLLPCLVLSNFSFSAWLLRLSSWVLKCLGQSVFSMFWIGFDKNLAKMFRALTLMPGIVPRTIRVLPHLIVVTALYFGLTIYHRPCRSVLWTLPDRWRKEAEAELLRSLTTAARPAGDRGKIATKTGSLLAAVPL